MVVFLVFNLCLSALAKEDVIVIKCGEIHTISGGLIQKGMVLLEKGKIRFVGDKVKIPRGAKVIDANGLIVTPGIIDARSGYGLSIQPNQKDYFNPARRIIDFFKSVEDSTWLKSGVTATYITPPPSDLLGGFGAVVKLVGNKDEAVINDAAGMSVSIGEGALKGLDIPTSRQGRIAWLRVEFIRAMEYMELRKEGGSGKTMDPKFEAMLRVIRREVPLRVLANTPDDIITALRFAKEFNLRLVIDSGAGAHKVAHLLVEAGVAVVVGPSILGLGSGGPFELFAHTPENASKLHKAGVKTALGTDDSGVGRSILLEGVIAKSHGLPEDVALRAVTLNAAEILGVSNRLGSIEPGKDGDIVIWKGHPLSTWGEARTVIVNGKIVFER